MKNVPSAYCKGYLAAQVIHLAHLYSVMAQDGVRRSDMEIEIRNDPSQQILLADKLKVPLFTRQPSFALS